MAGGLRGWQGLKAEGSPEVAMNYFSRASSTEEFISLAWLLEEGTRKFYQELAGTLDHQGVVALFKDLAQAEEHHKTMLKGLYVELTGDNAPSAVENRSASLVDGEEVIEGGVRLEDALHWAGGKDKKAVLEFSIALEANAYDRYLLMRQKVSGENSKRVFHSLSRAEKHHLERLSEALDALL
jgi:sulfur-carrier protein adenylyltransferase/sulfurtransferase